MGFDKGQPQPIKGQSALRDWLLAHVNHQGDECLMWPFGKSRGYPIMPWEGKIKKAHRIMCKLAHGAPPTIHYEAAHSCGRGAEGCINPKHLSWKTRAENQRDRRAHGTAGNGGMGRRRRLTLEQVKEIRANQGTETVASLASRFGVTRSAIRKIHIGEIWTTEYGSPEQDKVVAVLPTMPQPARFCEMERHPELSNILNLANVLTKLEKKGVIQRVRRGFYKMTSATT